MAALKAAQHCLPLFEQRDEGDWVTDEVLEVAQKRVEDLNEVGYVP